MSRCRKSVDVVMFRMVAIRDALFETKKTRYPAANAENKKKRLDDGSIAFSRRTRTRVVGAQPPARNRKSAAQKEDKPGRWRHGYLPSAWATLTAFCVQNWKRLEKSLHCEANVKIVKFLTTRSFWIKRRRFSVVSTQWSSSNWIRSRLARRKLESRGIRTLIYTYIVMINFLDYIGSHKKIIAKKIVHHC